MNLWSGAFAMAVLMAAPAAFAERERFGQGDYARYFSGGSFESYSPFYQSHGRLDVLSNQVTGVGEIYMLKQSFRSFDVSVNYDQLSEYPYYKIRSDVNETMMWDNRMGGMMSSFGDDAFDADSSLVWESHNQTIAVTDDDVGGMRLHEFYKRADERAGLDPVEMDEDFRGDSTGIWLLQCDYLRGEEFDVECRSIHQPSLRVETHFYRRLDLTS